MGEGEQSRVGGWRRRGIRGKGGGWGEEGGGKEENGKKREEDREGNKDDGEKKGEGGGGKTVKSADSTINIEMEVTDRINADDTMHVLTPINPD